MFFFDRLTDAIVSPPAFGLDISDVSVKFVKFVKSFGGELRITDFGEIKVPEGIVVSGEIKEEKKLTALLKNDLKTFDGRHFHDRFVVATLPEEKSFVHLIQLPKMKEEDAGRAVRWELEGIVPLPIDELSFDHSILPVQESADHLDLLVTAFPKVFVESFARVLEEAGFVPIALELESQAISRSLSGGDEGAFIFVDIGATRTSSMIVANGSLIFTLSIPLGGLDFDRSIAKRMNISIEKAREVKIKIGLAKGDDSASFESLLPLVSAIADELKRQIIFYREHTAHRHGMPDDISTIVLSGGDANLIGLANYLSITLGKEVKLGNSLARLIHQKKFIPPFPKNVSLKYTTAIGSALRGAGF
ncbi:MAG: type IV pilus assembly protein PilM [bacterium]|nr:type IV pilus assembly protein PilM [bacterium]